MEYHLEFLDKIYTLPVSYLDHINVWKSDAYHTNLSMRYVELKYNW